MAKKSDSPLHGLLLVDKPAGWTSHDVVAKVRRLTGQRRLGHTGTLDPAATGLLVLCLGQATRLVEYITAHEKHYTGEIVLGVTTTTDDAEGEALESRPVPPLEAADLRALEVRFRGELQQIPPAYSAVSISGQRAYAVARRGGRVELPPRRVIVHRIELAQAGPARLSIDVQCGPGTYIRSLARDIGNVLGCGAHLDGLRRRRSGPFPVEDAWSLAEVETIAGAGRVAEILLPADEGMTDCDAAILDEAGLRALGFGQLHQVPEGAIQGSGIARIYGTDGSFNGVASVSSSGEIRALKVTNLHNSA